MHPKSIKQFPNRSRIVPDTEYTTNLGIINLKIKDVSSHFLYPFTSYSVAETFIWSEQNIFYKIENVFVSFFKN